MLDTPSAQTLSQPNSGVSASQAASSAKQSTSQCKRKRVTEDVSTRCPSFDHSTSESMARTCISVTCAALAPEFHHSRMQAYPKTFLRLQTCNLPIAFMDKCYACTECGTAQRWQYCLLDLWGSIAALHQASFGSSGIWKRFPSSSPGN